MALFKWLGGKTAAEHEKRADALFAEQAWGKAKLEYEKALDKLESVAAPDAAFVRRLKERARQSCQALAEEEREADPLRTNALAEDHFMILCSMLPDELQDIYSGYGPSFQQGYVALHEGRFEQAADLLSEAHQESTDECGYISLELAGAYFNLGRLGEARGLLEKFVAHNPEALPGYEMLGEIYWEQEDFESAWRLLKNCPQPLQASVAFVVLYGETLRREARYDEAAQWFTDHMRGHGWNDKIAIALATVYEQSEKTDEALAIYASYMNNCRGCGARTPPEVERKYADLSLAGGNHNDQILEIYLALARKDPANAAEYYLNASRIYAARGNPSEAMRFKGIAEQFVSDR